MLYTILVLLVLLLIGLRTGYVTFSTWGWWRYCWTMRHEGYIGIFRNLSHVKPGRWGFYIGGFEVGSRNPQNKIGVWLETHHLYPW